MRVNDNQKKVAHDLKNFQGFKSKPIDAGGAPTYKLAEAEANRDGGGGKLRRTKTKAKGDSEERTKKKDCGGAKLKKPKPIKEEDSDDDFVKVKSKRDKKRENMEPKDMFAEAKANPYGGGCYDNFVRVKGKRHMTRTKMEPKHKFAVAESGAVDKTPLGQKGYSCQSAQRTQDVQRVGNKQDTVVEVAFDVYVM